MAACHVEVRVDLIPSDALPSVPKRPRTRPYTRGLLDRGVSDRAKKLGEESIETVLAAVRGSPPIDFRDRRSHLSLAGRAQSARRFPSHVEAALAERSKQAACRKKSPAGA